MCSYGAYIEMPYVSLFSGVFGVFGNLALLLYTNVFNEMTFFEVRVLSPHSINIESMRLLVETFIAL
jgi:hypothetical protein